ncbi:histidine kinase [Aquimarina atlantica]|uniref:Histidine kinase n=1 Tax=Aquimarina atlantica TaxID=1317122 RepID=A0A023C098_9FLAO|nr:histidine kinase [Aquimarina atlantica]EZH75680.1 histidine kinase [Aquimarina atlantica]
MALFNKKKRIQYLGFNDIWFSVIGILIISLITNYLFNNPSERASIELVLIGWFASLIPTICDWCIIRFILIHLRKRYPDFKDDLKRIVFLLFAIICVILFVDFTMGFLLAQLFTFLGFYSTHMVILKVLLPVFLIIIMTMAIYEAIYYYVRLKKSIRDEEQTKQIMIQAQLDTLRNQAQPHFLFNSLNTLRDIIDQDAKEDAKGFVDNLSDVYRFILESGNTNLISLQKELKFAKAYIHIQSERFGDNLKVNWRILQSKQMAMIVPMSLQLLLENAIKHNIVSRAKPLIITIETKEDYLVVSNKIQSKSTQTPSTKIGLKNIEKRYQLISNRAPIIDNDGEHFTVALPLLKASNQNTTHENTNH